MKNKYFIIIIFVAIIFVIGGLILLLNRKPAKSYNLNEEITMKVKEKIKVDDMSILFVSVTDNTCPPGVECVWSGEYLYELLVNNEKITLSSITKKEFMLDNYVFVLLEDSSDEIIRFTVNKKA